ncbi:DUF4974 domain-containing protein [Chitinophaga sp. SYP-B3965]|uniref:FecR family protein n=1 Tax=Chitinophaga sp. SYP-B3965 TaxID=2663120 RepID=UPI00129996B9|nr:FecR domain-containing protein [Chitinophaga sp. SYP-B3965]MRG45830.1 DUF4974 domain-containing protein [Chitinophaga sp. SYP-B3965]
MEHQKDAIELLERYRTGICTPEEIKRVDDWFDRFEQEPVPLHAKHKEVNRAVMRMIRGRKNYVFLRVAAVLAVLLGISALWLFRQQPATRVAYLDIQAMAGEKKKIILPDGSRVLLNSVSHLRFPEKFAANRELFLDGEAFFEVNVDEEHPFIVHTDSLDVQVLGTSFNVSSYKEEQRATVTVASGKVQVNDSLVVNPGEQLTYKNGLLMKAPVDTTAALAWQKGILIFKDQSLESICQRLERWYGVSIEIRDQPLKRTRFSLTQNNETISNVMESLSLSGKGFRYKITNREIIIW